MEARSPAGRGNRNRVHLTSSLPFSRREALSARELEALRPAKLRGVRGVRGSDPKNEKFEPVLREGRTRILHFSGRPQWSPPWSPRSFSTRPAARCRTSLWPRSRTREPRNEGRELRSRLPEVAFDTLQFQPGVAGPVIICLAGWHLRARGAALRSMHPRPFQRF